MFLSSKQGTADGSLDNTETNNEDTAMESEITEHAIGIAYSLVNTCLSQLCECYCVKNSTFLQYFDLYFSKPMLSAFNTVYSTE